MSVARLFLAAALASGCRSAPADVTPPASPAPMVRTAIRISGPFYPASGDSAVRAFVPEVQPVDSGGECRVIRTSGSGATIVTAYFPSFASARTAITLSFDSAGSLVRYLDWRGGIRVPTRSGMSAAQADSVRRATDEAVRTTSIQLDYPLDQALASNRGGGRPVVAVIGPVRSLERLDQLGPPIRRLQHARRLCGV